MPIATTMTGTIKGDRISAEATTRSALGRRAMPSAAKVPTKVASTTTAAATQLLSQAERSQSSLAKNALYQRSPMVGGGKVRYAAEEKETTITTTMGSAR